MKTWYKHKQLVTIGVETFIVEHDYRHSAPMPYMARMDAYNRQNGDRPLTARQIRQLDRKSRTFR